MKKHNIDKEDLIRRHVTLSVEMFDLLIAESEESHGGNVSLLIRKIIAEYYRKKKKV